MKINETLQKSLALANNSATVTELIFKNLLQNCFAVLTGLPEPHNITSLYNSKPDLIKELYAVLLSVTAEFVRTGQTIETITQLLTQCGYNEPKTKLFGELYVQSRGEIEASLINIGSHLPHVTDVTWKIDYIIKSSCLDGAQGPLFRIGFQTETYDLDIGGKKIDFVNFTCDSYELQDLVYKLKDALKHCQRIGNEH